MATSRAPAQGGLRIRKLADRSAGPRYNTLTGEPEPWPLAGIAIEGDTPARCTVPSGFVDRGVAEGWLTGEGHRVEVRPAGTAAAPWAPTPTAPGPHVFHHYDALVLHTVAGDVRYRVTHQPDKYAVDGDDSTPVTDDIYAAGETRVDHFYVLELEA